MDNISPLHLESLSTPVTDATVDAYQHRYGSRLLQKKVIFGIAALVMVLICIPLLADTGGSSATEIASEIVFFGLFVAAGVFVALMFYKQDRKKSVSAIRARSFAADNGFLFGGERAVGDRDGMYFTVGDDRKVYATVSGQYGGVPFEIGNISYVTGSGRSRRTTTLGYTRVGLAASLPQIVLDGRANNVGVLGLSVSNLPTAYRGNQKFSLEGDFDKYFTLYAPQGYETDALYVFTPDLMARFIDHAAIYDAELYGNSLYTYGKTLDFNDPAQIAGLFDVIRIVGGKAVKQTRAYTDMNMAPGAVASPGRPKPRLRTRTSVISLVVTLFIVYQYGATVYSWIRSLLPGLP